MARRRKNKRHAAKRIKAVKPDKDADTMGGGFEGMLERMAKNPENFIVEFPRQKTPKNIKAVSTSDTSYDFKIVHDGNFVDDGDDYEEPLPIHHMTGRFYNIRNVDTGEIVQVRLNAMYDIGDDVSYDVAINCDSVSIDFGQVVGVQGKIYCIGYEDGAGNPIEDPYLA